MYTYLKFRAILQQSNFSSYYEYQGNIQYTLTNSQKKKKSNIVRQDQNIIIQYAYVYSLSQYIRVKFLCRKITFFFFLNFQKENFLYHEFDDIYINTTSLELDGTIRDAILILPLPINTSK